MSDYDNTSDSASSEDSMETPVRKAKINDHMLNIMLTNARSLSPKIDSLQDNFYAHNLDVALITESWLKDGTVLDNDVIDLEQGTGLGIIYKNRSRRSTARRVVGGGVSIVFNKNTTSLRERKVRGNKFELVIATGRIGTLPRQLVFICIYIEPRMKAADLKELNELICDEIISIKAKTDPLFFIGGDLNRRSLEDALSPFNDIQQINFAPTRGEVCQDVMFSNLIDISSSVWPPLQSRNGTDSDNSCVVYKAAVPKTRDFEWIRVKRRRVTIKATAEFGRRLKDIDWYEQLPPSLNPDEMVERYEKITADLVDELFPLQSSRRRSNDPPWITEGIRRLSRQKKRIFRRERKSNLYRNVSRRLAVVVAERQKDFVDAMAKSGNPRQYFRAVKAVGSKVASQDWNLKSLFPEGTEVEAGEKAADFFTAITNTFQPLMPDRTDGTPMCPEISVEDVK